MFMGNPETCAAAAPAFPEYFLSFNFKGENHMLESFPNAVKINDPKSLFGCTIREGVPRGLPVCGMLNITSGCSATGPFLVLAWLRWLSFSMEGPRNVRFFGGIHHPFF